MKKNGFTLIEMIVVVGLLSTIGLVASTVFFSTLKGGTKAEILKEVKQNGDFAISTMERVIRSALEVTSTCEGSDLTSIEIFNPDHQSTIFDCLWEDDVAKIASNGAALTSETVTLGNSCPGSLSFNCQRSTNAPEVIKISFTLSQKGSPTRSEEKASVTFQTAVSLRSYTY